MVQKGNLGKVTKKHVVYCSPGSCPRHRKPVQERQPVNLD